jgi:glycosyltransferase involved in cell wall biosynthesis
VNIDPEVALYDAMPAGVPWRVPSIAALESCVDNRGLHVLHWSRPDTSNGYAVRAHGLLASLQRSGWDPIGVTRPGYDKPATKVDGISYLRLGDQTVAERTTIAYLDVFRDRLIELARELRPSVIHAASEATNAVAAIEAARALDIPSVYELRGLWPLTRLGREPASVGHPDLGISLSLEVEAAKAADGVVAISDQLANWLIRRGVAKNKIIVVPNGVDVERFTPQPRDETLAAELGVTDKVVIGYAGAIVEYEGLENLLLATTKLRHLKSRMHVLIIGHGYQFDELRRMSDDLGLADVVTFTGRVPHEDIERYYSCIDIAPFPRLNRPVTDLVSPLKPLEVMAQRKAVVVSSSKGLKDLASAGVARSFPGSSYVELAKVLEELVTDDSAREVLAQAGYEWVRATRRWDDVIVPLYAMLTTLSAQQMSAAPSRGEVA